MGDRRLSLKLMGGHLCHTTSSKGASQHVCKKMCGACVGCVRFSSAEDQPSIFAYILLLDYLVHKYARRISMTYYLGFLSQCT